MRAVRWTVAAWLAAAVGTAQEKRDSFGDQLPKGATARLGTPRGVLPPNVEHLAPLPPDFKTVAFVERDKGLVIQETATGRVVRRFDVDGPRHAPEVVTASGDGSRVAVVESRDLIVREVATGRVVLRQPAPTARVRSNISLSGDGKRIAHGISPPRRRTANTTTSWSGTWTQTGCSPASSRGNKGPLSSGCPRTASDSPRGRASRTTRPRPSRGRVKFRPRGWPG